jgi:methyl-accepting chemotaxis protein
MFISRYIKDWSIRKRLYYALYILVGVSVVIAIVAFIGILSINKQIHTFSKDSHKIETTALYAENNLLEIKQYIYKTLLTDNIDYQLQYIQEAENYFLIMSSYIDELCEEDSTIKSITIEQRKVLKGQIDKAYRYRKEILKCFETKDTKQIQYIFKNSYAPVLDVISSTIADICETSSVYSMQYVKDSKIKSYATMGAFLLLTLLSIVCGNILSKKTARYILTPMDEIMNSMKVISEGKLDINLSYHDNNEFGILFKSIEHTIVNLKGTIHNIEEMLSSIENKDLTQVIEYEYKGDFKPIKTSLEGIQRFMSEALMIIKNTSTQLYVDADNVLMVGQLITKGANEQYNSIQSLNILLKQVEEKIKDNSAEISYADRMVTSLEENIKLCNVNMNQLVENVDEINLTFTKMNEVNNIIQYIAEQTNLLALNATIESSRHGSQGQGMGVIAKEIQKLSKECEQEVSVINTMIRNCHTALIDCKKNTKDVANELNHIHEYVKQSKAIFGGISKECQDIEIKIIEVMDFMTGIEGVVRENMITSEKGLDSGEALKNQANNLKVLLGTFHINTNSNDFSL